jgi:hypothetical protein
VRGGTIIGRRYGSFFFLRNAMASRPSAGPGRETENSWTLGAKIPGDTENCAPRLISIPVDNTALVPLTFWLLCTPGGAGCQGVPAGTLLFPTKRDPEMRTLMARWWTSSLSRPAMTGGRRAIYKKGTARCCQLQRKNAVAEMENPAMPPWIGRGGSSFADDQGRRCRERKIERTGRRWSSGPQASAVGETPSGSLSLVPFAPS